MSSVVASGSFTSAGAVKDIALRSDFDIFECYNYTQAATTQTTGRGCAFRWQRGFADNAGMMWTKEDSGNALDLEVITSGGFLRVDESVQAPEAAVTGTAITAANPAVVTATSHGYAVGDRVRIGGSTGMLQIGGYEFTVTAVADANTFTLGYLDASGFAAAATALSARRIPNDPLYAPSKNWITGISQAASAVVTLSVTHGLAVNDEVRLSVPAACGMVEADGLAGKVTAVATNTVTLDIDSSGFTAFALPASASAGSPALLIPFGVDSTNSVAQALDNDAQILMRLGAGADGPAGSSSDVIYWEAKKSLVNTNE